MPIPSRIHMTVYAERGQLHILSRKQKVFGTLALIKLNQSEVQDDLCTRTDSGGTG